MTDNGNRLFITEFDTIQKDIHERALDLEDFIRLAYSYPYTDGIILWNFMRTKNAGEGSNEWDVHMFEDEINSLSEPYLTANNGEPYPLYPNEVRDILTKRTLFSWPWKYPCQRLEWLLLISGEKNGDRMKLFKYQAVLQVGILFDEMFSMGNTQSTSDLERLASWLNPETFQFLTKTASKWKNRIWVHLLGAPVPSAITYCQ